MRKLLNFTDTLLIGMTGDSYTKSYDAYGNSRQTIAPTGAAIGVIVLGALAYSIGKAIGSVITVTITNQQGMERIMVGDKMTILEIPIPTDKII